MRWLNNLSISLATCILISTSDQPANGQAAKVENPLAGVRPTQSRTFIAQQAVGTALKPQEGDPAAETWTRYPSAPGVQNAPGYAFSQTVYSNSAQRKLQSKVDAKIRQYTSSNDNKKKKDIEGEIRDLLSQQFDERLKEPKMRVESSRKRLEELKSQIKRRADKADEIVDLRLKVLTNEAMGLGWSSGHQQWRTTTNTIYVPHPTQPNAYMPTQRQQTRFYPSQPAKAPSSLNSTGPARLPQVQPPTSVVQRPVTNTQEPYSSGYRLRNRAPKSSQQQLPNDDKPSMPQLIRDYKKHVETDKDVKSIEKAMRSLLKDEFDNYQKQLSNSADRIEEQISKLEKNLSERKKMKESIVELKLKTVINQANGLGF